MDTQQIARLDNLRDAQQQAARVRREHESACTLLGREPCSTCLSTTVAEHIAFNRWANARLRKPKPAARGAAGGEAT